MQDAFADASPKVDDKGQPVYKTADRAVTKDDLANKDVPLPTDLAVGDPYPVFAKDADGKLALKDGHAIPVPFTVSYKAEDAVSGTQGDAKNPLTFNFHQTATSVVAPHSFNYIFIQACIAILILVGFESVTAMGEEAKNAKRDVPRAVLLSLLIQGCFCYFLEYFAANYFFPQRLHDVDGGGFRCAHRRSDGSRGFLVPGVVSGGLVVHDDPGHDRVPGADRHDAFMPEHRSARDLRDGPGG